ncbi:MAG: vanadium-dependent haloperoxidase [Symploca sp. SIO2E6]|nr:vanadium-dependent haloperoxidase [Symploca sp. SIO2E6]
MYAYRFRLLSKTILATAAINIFNPAQAAVLGNINEIFLQSIRNTGTVTPEVARTGALVYLSVYDAINGIDLANNPNQGFEQYFTEIIAPTNASQESAAIAAAQEVLQSLYPEDNAFLDTSFNNLLNTIPDTSSKTIGINWGQSVAQQLLALRSDDGANLSDPYTPNTSIGGFDGSWGSQQYRNVTPFSVGIDLSDFTASSPPELTSYEYAQGLNEVQSLGELHSVTRSADQSQAAKFWQQAGGTSRPTGVAFEIANTYAQSQTLTLQEEARLFGLVSLANIDATIATWQNKALYDFWRPRDAIRSADLDGNPLTTVDSEWEAFRGIGSQGSSPEYTSGQSTFAGAWSTVLRNFNGDNNFDFDLTLDTLGPETVRSFASFSEAAREAGNSRVWLGTHFSFTVDESLKVGENLGQFVFSSQLQPIQPASVPGYSSIVALLMFGGMGMLKIRC